MRQKIRKHLIFKGRVQGVGFRFVARHSAEAIGLTGWVRNCWDGSVEAEVQGTSEEIGLFLKKIYEARYIQIEDLEAKQLPSKEDRGFQVLHG